jgi:long-chain fatty acid transport protein
MYMKTKTGRTLARLAVLGTTLASTSTRTARAGGIELYEIATPDVGLASAGYAARADDASTLFKNPAGMSRLDGTQFQGGAQALYGSIAFSPGPSTSARLGTDGGPNAIGWLPGASLFLTVPLGEKFHVGLGTFSYFGLASDYGSSWVGRYYMEKSALLGLSVMPSVSFKATDWLSIGAGLNAMYGYLNSDVGVNNVIGPDGKMSLKSTTWGFGADLGALIQPCDGTRFGITYLSAVDLPLKATPSFTGLGPGLGAILANPPQLNLSLTVPQSVMLSVYQALNDEWALMSDFGWQNWHQFGEVQAGVEAGGTTTVNLDFQNTWHTALGAQFHPTDQWAFSAGAAYDSSAVNSANRTVAVPLGQTWRFGLGAQYQLTHAINIGLAETYMWLGDLSVYQGSAASLRGQVAGSYNNAWTSVTALSVNCKF